MDGAREPAPAVLGLEAPADALVGDGVQEDAQRHQRGEGQAEGHLGGAAEVAERRVHEEPDHADQREHEPAGEALEHDRRERLGRLAGVAGEAGDPQHVAADGGGQHVGHELAGQAVATRAAGGRRGARAPRARAASAPPTGAAPTRVSAMATLEPADRCGRRAAGRTSSRSIGGIRQIRIASISALRPMRSTSDTACFRFNRPLSPSLERWSIVDVPTGGPAASVRCRHLGARRAQAAARDPPHHESHTLGGSMFRKARTAGGRTAAPGRPPAPTKADDGAVEVKTGDAAVSALRAAPDAAADAGTARFEMVMEMAVLGRVRSRSSPPAPTTPTPQQMSHDDGHGRAVRAARRAAGEDAPRRASATAPWRWSSTATPSTCGRRCSRCSPAPRAGCR